MKVRIPAQTVEVDPEKWATEYHLELSEVRQDVKEYFSSWPQDQVERLGLQPQSRNGD